jgi:magnesium transporter
MDISIICYNSSFTETHKIFSIDEIPQYTDDTITWVNIEGLEDIDFLKNLAKKYDIHPLTIEDVLNTKQQPKFEIFENYRFVSFKSIRREKKFNYKKEKQKRSVKFSIAKNKDQTEDEDDLFIEQISLIVMKNILITIQEVPGDPFDNVRKRIFENTGRVRKMNADYLAYALLDSVTDEYYLTLAHLEEDIENFEDRAVLTNNDNFISDIQDAKKYLFQLKRIILPLRDIIINMIRQNLELKNKELKPFLQDLHENLNNAMETVENYREWLTNIMDVNLSVLSYQLNKVMKILAVISAIFIPLTFIAGVYGMNFQFMPELSRPMGYPIVLCGMGLVALTMVIFFKFRKWF